MAKKGGRVSVKGVEKVVAANKKFVQKSLVGTAMGLRMWAEETMTVIKKDFVPFKHGILRGSGQVASKKEGDDLLVELSFGGDSPAGAYAAAVHEKPASHKHGTDKYLEKGTAQESSKLDDRIVRSVKRSANI